MSRSALRKEFNKWMRDNPPGMQKYGIADLHKLTSQALGQLDEMAKALDVCLIAMEDEGIAANCRITIRRAHAALDKYHDKEKPPGESG